MTVRSALVIGAGIAGPVTAMALQRAGIEATIHEAYGPPDRARGSYLTVATNGLSALAAIDAAHVVHDVGFATPRMLLMSGSGRRLGAVPSGAGGSADLPVSRTMRRADLHRALADEAFKRGLHIEYRKQLVGVESRRGGVRATFADGTTASAAMLIGCDGVHSTTRRLIDPASPAPRYVGLLNFGGYTGTSEGERGVWHMIFGRRAFFGYVADDRGGTAWFANVPRHAATEAERASRTPAAWRDWLAELFCDDRGPATALIAGGQLELVADNTHDLPVVPVWHRDRVSIIGDAAHAPAPTSGQGASLALEDAVVLAQCVRDAGDPAAAFAAFERQRRDRVERVVAFGARGSSSKAAGAVGRVVRDALMPLMCKWFVTQRSMAWLYEHRIARLDTPLTVPQN